MPGKNTPEKGSSSVIVSLNPDGIVTAKPYHDDIVVDLNPKTKLMENIGYQNDQNSEKQPTSSCNSSTAELHHTSRNSKAHLCDAERCSKKNNSSMPSPWHRLKSIFLSVLLVLFFLWILLLIVLINKNAL
ncbi:hypothetical protein M8J76_000188 [Diaphorina citri]|nr:hypothetical protein M8J76_000188 [Diaphorina citri]KAI5746844.1 hypothetical protein M8J77_008066 [Diaphorina citri]